VTCHYEKESDMTIKWKAAIAGGTLVGVGLGGFVAADGGEPERPGNAALHQIVSAGSPFRLKNKGIVAGIGGMTSVDSPASVNSPGGFDSPASPASADSPDVSVNSPASPAGPSGGNGPASPAPSSGGNSPASAVSADSPAPAPAPAPGSGSGGGSGS
jgi:hypothetical protein